MRKAILCMAMLALVFGAAANAAEPNATDLGGDGVGGTDQGPRGALPEGGVILWDNGDTDGTNGYSNGTAGSGAGARRELLDDFEIPDGDQWSIRDFHWIHVWSDPGTPIPHGTDFELCFYNELPPGPGNLIGCTTNTSYLEEATGRVWFSRPEAVSWLEFDPVVLGTGTYWMGGTIVGQDNNFWLVKGDAGGSRRLDQCYTDYDDFPPVGPCELVFGTPNTDLSFALTGDLDGQCRIDALLVRQPRVGQPLVVDLSILHKRNQTVRRPFELSIVDRDGNVLASRTTRPFTMEYGRTINTRQKMSLPRGIGRGEYDLVVSMDGMRGGKRIASVSFRIR